LGFAVSEPSDETLGADYWEIIFRLATWDGSRVWSNTKNTWVDPFEVMNAEESIIEKVLVGAL